MTSKKTTKKKTTKKVAKKVAKKKVTKKAIKKTAAKKIAIKVTKKVASKVTKKKTTKKISKKVTKKKVAKKTIKKKTVVKKTGSTAAKNAPKNAAKKKVTKKTRRRRGISVSDAAREAEADDQGYVFINGRKVRLITTNGVSKKKKRSSRTKGVIISQKKVVNLKTPLNAKQLREYRDRLLKYRAQLLVDLGAIEKEALNANSDSSHMPIHMADVGSDAYDQDLKLGMAASERRRVRDIEEALMRIKKKTYGVCHLTGSIIPDARLRAKPWAKYTKDSAEKVERRSRLK